MKGAKPTIVTDEEAITDIPPAPEWFSQGAREEWERVTPMLVQRRILTVADLGSLENYCVSIGRVREIEKRLSDVSARTNADVFSKLFRTQDKAMQSARLLAAELGLTPVSRSRQGLRGGIDDDSLLD